MGPHHPTGAPPLEVRKQICLEDLVAAHNVMLSIRSLQVSHGQSQPRTLSTILRPQMVARAMIEV